MTLRPAWSARETSLPSASGRVKAGAVSPGWRRSLMGAVLRFGVPTGAGTSVLTDCLHGTGRDNDGGCTVSDGRSPAQIEADIALKRRELAATLDEIAVRVHPATIAADTKAKVASAVDRTAGRAYVAVNRGV